MAVFNLGSINIDNVFTLDRLPVAGETLSANNFLRGLGGKGANQSVALAKAGSETFHIGATGSDGVWMRDALADYNIDVSGVEELRDVPSGQAIVYVDSHGENSIVIHAGANRQMTLSQIEQALAGGQQDDWLVMQNETNMVLEAAKHAKKKRMKVAYSAAPFDATVVDQLLSYLDMIVVNEIEMQQLEDALPHRKQELQACNLLVTKGSQGALFREVGETAQAFTQAAFKVEAIDTTGAGDTYFGFFVASLDQGKSIEMAMQYASAAAALQITRVGAAAAIPDFSEVEEFLSKH